MEPPRETYRLTPNAENTFDRDVAEIRQRVLAEATSATAMLEEALSALWDLDTTAAADVRERDSEIDAEEVAIEEACFKALTLHQPFARDFRRVAFVLKVNADVERIGDHATAIAKTTQRLAKDGHCDWPPALRELGERVPLVCHAGLRALADSNVEAAQKVIAGDVEIDAIHRQLFDEIVELAEQGPNPARIGLLLGRIGRDLERIGDLISNMCEDLIYLETGEIVRHVLNREARQGKSA